MMRRFVLPWLLLIFLSGGVFAQGTAGDAGSSIMQLIQAADVKGSLQALCVAALQEVDSASNLRDPRLHGYLKKAAEHAFNADGMYQEAVRYFTSHDDEANAQGALAWYSSPLGKAFTRAENAAATSEGEEEMDRYMRRLQYSPPSPERMGLIRRLDDATGSTDSLVKFFTLFSEATVRLSAANAPASKRPSEAQIQGSLKKVVDEEKPKLHQASLVNLLATYRNMSDGDLQKYLDFLQSDGGRWYTRVSNAAFIQILADHMNQAFAETVEAMKQQGR